MTQNNPSTQMSTVHDAMKDAQAERTEPTVCKSFRVEPEVFEAAQKICERNGTSVSQFCRKALHRLLMDYGAMFHVEQKTNSKAD
jgi:predicted HicB family RNase H-like nuclease